MACLLAFTPPVWETSYRFVGKGEGEFEMQANSRLGLFWISTGCLCLTALLCVACWCFRSASARPTEADLDCSSGLESWRHSWSEAKRAWCCQRHQVGCTTSSRPHDCTKGFSSWQSGWSNAKKAWCCAQERVGCRPLPFDCNEGFTTKSLNWTVDKRYYCCLHARRGCPTLPPHG